MLCNICLDSLQSPAVTPCGHVFCLNCLISSCQKSPDATKAPCPTCRTSFSLVTPNTIFIPEKYRQFIDSNVRRLFLDNSGEEALQDKVEQLEARVKSLETQKDTLMNKCESYMTASSRHAENEKDMRAECSVLQNQLTQANIAVAELISRENQRIVGNRKKEKPAAVTHPDPTVNSASPEVSITKVGIQPKGEKRHSGVHTRASLNPNGRPTIPLPKRRRA